MAYCGESSAIESQMNIKSDHYTRLCDLQTCSEHVCSVKAIGMHNISEAASAVSQTEEATCK